MTVPICTVHNKPMKQFEWGWKCTTKTVDGWCNQRMKFGTQAPPQAAEPTHPDLESVKAAFAGYRMAGPPITAKQACARASMDFVARIFQGTGEQVTPNTLVALVGVVYNGLLPLFEAKE